MPAPPLIIQIEQITPSFFLFAALLALGIGQYIISLYIPRRYPHSNRRAKLCTCPPSSASTAENSPATDHGAWTASKNATHGSTPDPRATPQRGDWATPTGSKPRQWWQQHRCVPSAVNHQPRKTR